MEHEITAPRKLLDGGADLREPVFARSHVLDRDRAYIKSSAWRTKERNYYYEFCGDHALEFTIADNGYMRIDSVSVLDLASSMNAIDDVITTFSLGSRKLSTASSSGVTEARTRGVSLCLVASGTPSGVGPLRAGDVFEVEIDGIGVLRNPVTED